MMHLLAYVHVIYASHSRGRFGLGTFGSSEADPVFVARDIRKVPILSVQFDRQTQPVSASGQDSDEIATDWDSEKIATGTATGVDSPASPLLSRNAQIRTMKWRVPFRIRNGANSNHGMARAIPDTLFLTSRFPTLDDMEEPQKSNVQRMIQMNRDLEPIHFNNRACFQYLSKKADDSLASRFTRYVDRGDGKFASDVCRAVYLYNEGGFYIDNDIELNVPLTELVHGDTVFMSAWPWLQSDDVSSRETGGLLNAIIGVEPHSKIMEKTIREIIKLTNEDFGNIDMDGLYLDGGWMGPVTLFRGFKTYFDKCNFPSVLTERFSESWPCGNRVKLYFEINAKSPPADVSSFVQTQLVEELDRDVASREGNLKSFALADLGDQTRLIGWSRCSGCNFGT